MRKNNKHSICALDIGSKKITLASCEMDSQGELGPIFIETQAAKGIFKGVVNDLAALSDSVGQVFKKMSARGPFKAQRLALSINGNYINASNSQAATALSERGTRSITRRDIERLNLQARTMGLELDEHLLHEYPQSYSIDKHNSTLNPLGLHGRKFGVDLLLISAKTAYIENITKAVEQAGVEVSEVVFSGIAAAEAVLTAKEKEEGVTLIDIGDALTGILIYKDNVVRRMNVISFGGRNLTEIIANYFKIPQGLADSIKESSLEMGREIQETEEVMIKADQEYRSIKKKEMMALIQPEIDKFIAMIKSIVSDPGLGNMASNKIVAIGGLSLLEGLLEKMESDLGLPVKMGLLKGLGSITASKAPAYASAIGALYLHQDACKNIGLKLQSESKNKISRIIDYVTTLYQDYF